MTAIAGAEEARPSQGAVAEPQSGSLATTRGSRLGTAMLLLTAPAATLYLSFSNGGFFPNSVGVAAICFCAALLLRVTLADRPFEGYTRVVGLAAVALGLFALLQLVSLGRSHTPAPALDDYDRTFLYVLVFVLFACLPRTWLRMDWLARLLCLAMSAACLAALVSRVLPHVLNISPGFFADRLDYPLGYWNALGMMGALAFILLLHFASSLREPWPVRIIAAALFPAVATTALLTYSRGAIGVGVLGLLVYAVLGRPRGLLSALVALGPTSYLALHAGYDAVLLSSNNPASPGAVAQGHHVAIMVGVAMAAAAGLRAAGLLLDRWLARPHSAPTALRRVPRWAWAAAGAGAAVLALVLAGAPGFLSREYNRFVVTRGPSAAQLRDRLTDPASDGRLVVWHVALEQFSHYGLLGEGAGTYQTFWAQHRTINDTVTDTHSLYLQTLGEDGIPGLILLAIALLCCVGVLARRIRGPERTLYAALFAAALAWALHNQFDWDWQMPAITLWIFAVGGLALARGRSSEGVQVSTINRSALAASFLALAIAPLLIGFSYQRLRASSVALTDRNCAVARQKALSSISLLAVRPQAYEILGYCDLQQSYPLEGLAAMRKAVSYDPRNWEAHYGLAIALGANGSNPLAEAHQAVLLNPRESLAQDELRAFQRAGSGGWTQAARGVLLEGLQSGALSVSNL